MSDRDHAKTSRDLLALALRASTQAEAEAAWGRALVVAREHGVGLDALLPPPPAPEGVPQERHERGLHEAFERGTHLGYARGERLGDRRGYERGVREGVEQTVAELDRQDGARRDAALARAASRNLADVLDDFASAGWRDGVSGFPPYEHVTPPYGRSTIPSRRPR